MLHQFLRRVELGDITMAENHDTVGVENGVDSMGDCDNRPILEATAPQSRLEECIGFNIDGSLVKMVELALDVVYGKPHLQPGGVCQRSGGTHSGFVQD